MKDHLAYGLFGLCMGLILSFIGFTNFEEVHKMFTLQDFRLIMTFTGAIGLLVIGFAILSRRRAIPAKQYNKGVIPGSILFGMGWAITGSCPSIALVQIGEGQLAAVFVVFGLFFGVWAYRRMATGNIKLDSGICGE